MCVCAHQPLAGSLGSRLHSQNWDDCTGQGMAGPCWWGALGEGQWTWGGLSWWSGWSKARGTSASARGCCSAAPGPNLPALGRSLRHPKAPQKAVGTCAQAHTLLLGPHVSFLGNPRAASTCILQETSFLWDTWTMSCRANHSLPCQV